MSFYLKGCPKNVLQSTSVSILNVPKFTMVFILNVSCRQHSFVEIDQEIFSTVILSLPLIQEGQLSVSGERMCTILVNRVED